MDHHQQQQQNRRRSVETGGGSGQNHPPPQPCPRCNSNNTKFCYYNNYSLSQPRYFCKGCRRYWTQGGTLRNVPVGGGCRKSKRPKLESGSGSGSGSGASSSHSQHLSQTQTPPHQQLVPLMGGNNSINNNNNINNNTSTTNTTIGTMMMSHHGLFGGGSSGLLSSLAAMQGVNQPLSFGPNLGLLHGFGLPNFDQQPVQQQNNQVGSIPSLYSTREVGSSSTPSMQEWNLRMGSGPGPAPVVTQTNLSDENHNRNHNHNNDNSRSNEQWSNFMGTSGLDDP